ncbi:MAG: HIT domain-containing protein, partial [Burkholderiales bacterium]
PLAGTAVAVAHDERTMIPDCIFCHPDRALLAESAMSLAFLDSFPVSKGHALIIPNRHVVSIWEMTAEEYADT